MPYVARNPDNSIYGTWATEQWSGQEFLPDGHADLLPTLDEYKAQAKREIDTEAGTARMRFPSPGFLVEQEYKRAEEQARAYAALGYSGAVPSCVQDWATVNGWTAQQSADDIIGTAEIWYASMDTIRGHRLTGKAAVNNAVDVAGVDAAKEAAIANLKMVVP